MDVVLVSRLATRLFHVGYHVVPETVECPEGQFGHRTDTALDGLRAGMDVVSRVVLVGVFGEIVGARRHRVTGDVDRVHRVNPRRALRLDGEHSVATLGVTRLGDLTEGPLDGVVVGDKVLQHVTGMENRYAL